MRLTKWVESLFRPEETNFKDAAIEDVILALNDPVIRKHWLLSLIDEIRAINVGVDKALRENDMSDLPNKSVRRNTIVFCLNEILESKRFIEEEILDQQRQAELAERKNAKAPTFQGITLEPFRKGEQS